MSLDGFVYSSVLRWLVDIYQGLNISLELIDDKLNPLVPALGGRSTSGAERLFSRLDDDVLRAAVSRSMQSLKQEVIIIDGIQVVCAPIVGRRGNAAGVALIAERHSSGDPENGGPTRLARLGTWLASAMEMHMGLTAHADVSELHHLSSLYRLLSQAVASESEREVVTALLEALAVWQDAESWAYVRDVTGRYVLDVSLPGSDRASMPAVIDGETLPTGTIARLSPADRYTLGFRGQHDGLLVRIRGQATSEWLLATHDPGDPRAEARLAVYAEAVSHALSEMAAVESARLTWAMLQHLVLGGDSLEHAATGAVDELATTIDAMACLVVSRNDGSPVLTAGEPGRVILPGAPEKTPDVLIVPIQASAPYTANIGVRRNQARPFTRRDEQLVHLTAAMLGAWVNGLAHRFPANKERRAGPTSFDRVVEQEVDNATERRQDISVIVVFLGPESARPDVAHACVAEIRRRLRPADMAGRLSCGHIGVVLPQTPADGARVVVDRMHQLVTSESSFGAFPAASIGVASRSAGSQSIEPLLHEARGQAIGEHRRMSNPAT